MATDTASNRSAGTSKVAKMASRHRADGTLRPGRPIDPPAAPEKKAGTRAHLAASFDTLPDTAYLRQPQLLEIVPFSAATLWRKCKAGEFPRPVKLSERVTAWQVGAVRRFIQVQSTGASS